MQQLDTDGNGKIDASELPTLFQTLGWDMTEKKKSEALEALDKNSDGCIDLEEFLEFSSRWWCAR